MTLEELQQLRDASDEEKIAIAAQHNFDGDIATINAWLDEAIANAEE